MTYSLTWLPEVLEKAGLKVAETVEWRTRGRAEMGPIKGVICHHTATIAGGNMPTLDILINGRSDLPGPLCHLGLGRDGTFYVVAAGRANHAGAGSWEGLDTGNSNFIGIEAENSGREDDPWEEVQLDAYKRGVAAILKHVGAGVRMCCGHKEYAPRRKVDPSFDMASFRADVAALLIGKSARPPIALEDEEGRPTLRRGMRSEHVKLLQQLLGLVDDSVFGANTEAKVRAWQRLHNLTADGIVGPKTWEQLVAQPKETPAVDLTHVESDPAAIGTTNAGLIDQIDAGFLLMAFPLNTAAELRNWIEPIKVTCRRYGIDTKREICSFLANIDVESRSLTRMSENLNYSVDGLLKTFGRHRISASDAQRLGRKPGEPALSLQRQEELANLLYGGDWGRENLGNTEAGDGWRFRGYGPKQITGRDNCRRFGEAVGLSIEQVPAFLRTPQGGCLGAGWFWKSHDLDRHAATETLVDDRKAINGGTLGLETVQKRFDVLLAELDRRVRAG